MARPLFDTWTCPRLCGYYRCYATDEHMKDIVAHPIYGVHTNRENAQADINSHDCNAYRAAHIRMMNRRRHG